MPRRSSSRILVRRQTAGTSPTGLIQATSTSPTASRPTRFMSCPFEHGKTLLDRGPMSYMLGNFRTSGLHLLRRPPLHGQRGWNARRGPGPFGEATAVPNVVGKPHIVGDPTCCFFAAKNQACSAFAPNVSDAYVLPAAGVVGNSGRNTLRGPRTNVF